ncbi:MAG TPA: TerC family protein [Herpetosiphonaceae bacterium]
MLDTANIWLWTGFTIFVLGMLALDLGVFHRSAHTVSLKEAGIWSAVWITFALVFNALVYAFVSPEAGLQFLTGYLIEKSLSVDNIFVFVLVFSYFSVPAMYQHRVLFWGIFGALVMRAILIATGAALIERFHWVIYIFGAFLVFTGIRMAFHKDEELHPEANPVVRLFKRFMPVVPEYHGQQFFVRHLGKLAATPLFVVLLLVESTDLVFALDSIPAIFAITTDPFIVYTSNVFAILGLRALYFLLAGVMDKFRYLKIGLSIVLVFVGVKMLIEAIHIEIPIVVSLGVIATVITTSVLASLWKTSREQRSETIHAGRALREKQPKIAAK